MDYPFISEIKAIAKSATDTPYDPIISGLFQEVAKEKNGGNMPAVIGACLFGKALAVINSVDFLDEIYVKHN